MHGATRVGSAKISSIRATARRNARRRYVMREREDVSLSCAFIICIAHSHRALSTFLWFFIFCSLVIMSYVIRVRYPSTPCVIFCTDFRFLFPLVVGRACRRTDRDGP